MVFNTTGCDAGWANDDIFLSPSNPFYKCQLHVNAVQIINYSLVIFHAIIIFICIRVLQYKWKINQYEQAKDKIFLIPGIAFIMCHNILVSVAKYNNGISFGLMAGSTVTINAYMIYVFRKMLIINLKVLPSKVRQKLALKPKHKFALFLGILAVAAGTAMILYFGLVIMGIEATYTDESFSYLMFSTGGCYLALFPGIMVSNYIFARSIEEIANNAREFKSYSSSSRKDTLAVLIKNLDRATFSMIPLIIVGCGFFFLLGEFLVPLTWWMGSIFGVNFVLGELIVLLTFDKPRDLYKMILGKSPSSNTKNSAEVVDSKTSSKLMTTMNHLHPR